MKCLNCEKETLNPKFCSKSCSASLNNKLSPKRKISKRCSMCTNIVRNYRSKLCEFHWNEHQKNKNENFKNRTLKYYRTKKCLNKLHKSSLHAHIRVLARSWFKELSKKPCKNCGYSKHVELCHIKPIASFSDNALLNEVNSEKNIIQLCPNCHWEFDNGLIKL